jgi:hypothetical protein
MHDFKRGDICRVGRNRRFAFVGGAARFFPEIPQAEIIIASTASRDLHSILAIPRQY